MGEKKKKSAIERILDNPATTKLIFKLIMKSLKYLAILICFVAGVYAVVNGLFLFFNLGWAGWILLGCALLFIACCFAVAVLRKNDGKSNE